MDVNILADVCDNSFYLAFDKLRVVGLVSIESHALPLQLIPNLFAAFSLHQSPPCHLYHLALPLRVLFNKLATPLFRRPMLANLLR